jgi:Protein of unknown function (DUF3300)
MKNFYSLVEKLLAITLALSMNLSLATAAPAISPAANQSGDQSAMSPDDLDKLLAPIALYPDALLMQVLAASIDSQEVLDGGNWLLENKTLQGDALDNASKSAGFGPAMMALFHFPQVVDMMCSEIDWTKQLGAAFNANQGAVLDSVQRLRLQAKNVGNLQTTSQQTVVTQQASGQQVIVIQPANPQVIYVPQYNPTVVYTTPPPSPGVSTESAVVGAFVAFGVGMAVGAIFANNNRYYYPHWGPGGGVYYGGRVWVSHSYVYRPVYHGGYRPATGYYRPPNYAYAYNRPYPGNTHYNSNNYYNNYRGNTNVQNRSNNTVNRNVTNNVTINNNNQVNNQNNKTRNSTTYNGNTQGNQGSRGQSTYNGANRNNGNASNSNTSHNPSNNRQPSNTSRPTTTQNVKPDRGYSQPTASHTAQQPKAQPASSNNKSAKAFEGTGNSAKSEKTASQRGASSNQGRKRGQ